MPEARAVDGATLAWEAEGEGPAVVLCNGIANDAFQWGAVRRALAGRARVVTWDYRGHGRSAPARDLGRLGVEHLAEDLRAVMDAAGVQTGALLGYSMGSQVVFEAWRRFPARVAGLVSVLGSAGRTFDNAAGPTLGRLVHAGLRRVPPVVVAAHLRAGAALPRAVHAGARLAGMFERDLLHDDFADWYGHLGTIHAPTFLAMAVGLQDHDAEAALSTVAVPTLVVSGGRDLFVRDGVGRRMAAAIPGAELAEFPRATHAGLVGHAGAIPPRIVAFLEGRGLIAPASAEARAGGYSTVTIVEAPAPVTSQVPAGTPDTRAPMSRAQ